MKEISKERQLNQLRKQIEQELNYDIKIGLINAGLVVFLFSPFIIALFSAIFFL